MATERLRAAIVNGDLGLGEALSESALAELLGISKTPVREALAKLKIEGLVKIVPQKGTFVFTLSAREVEQICELRFALESAALRFAFQRNRGPLLLALRNIVEKMTCARQKRMDGAYLRHDSEFHEQLFKYCDNKYLEDAYNLIVGKVAALRTHLAVRPQHTQKSYAEHKDIVRAIERVNVEGALTILEKHIARAKRSYTKDIEDIAVTDRHRFRRPLGPPKIDGSLP